MATPLRKNEGAAKTHWRKVADQFRPTLAKLAAFMDDAECNVLAYAREIASIEGRSKRFSTGSASLVRDEIQTGTTSRRVASIFDSFGHIWALVQRKAEDMLLAA